MNKNDSGPIRIAYLVTHPIQYQVPLLRRIQKEPNFDLTVFFRSDFSSKEFIDPDFGTKLKWDTNLLDGYRYEILPTVGQSDSFSFWRPFNFGLLKRLRSGKFHILWIHGYAMLFHLYAMITAKLLGIKVFIRDEPTLISKNRGKIRKAVKKLFFCYLNFFCSGFLAIGKLNRDYYLANGIPREKIFKMPYAVDNDFFQEKAELCAPNREIMRTSLGLAPERPVILYASKMSQRKRPMDLLTAFSEIVENLEKRPYLLFVGDGEQRSALEDKAVELNLEDDVLFLGFQNQCELPCFYDLCSVFVLPSVFEPWGLVINEAMNASRAVIASDQVGSAPDLIDPWRNGFIFKAGDTTELASAMNEALSNDEQCRMMGLESMEIISNWGFDQDIEGLQFAVNKLLINK
jgi:glycosyltransferase involved in cell wall biosynthesis